MALDRRNYRQLVETTVTLAQKVGCSQIVGRIVEDLKDESEPYRRMVMETIDKVPLVPSLLCLLVVPSRPSLCCTNGEYRFIWWCCMECESRLVHCPTCHPCLQVVPRTEHSLRVSPSLTAPC